MGSMPDDYSPDLKDGNKVIELTPDFFEQRD